MALTFTKDEAPGHTDLMVSPEAIDKVIKEAGLPWGLTTEAVDECTAILKDWETRADTSYTALIALLYPVLSKVHYIKNGEKLIKEAMSPIQWAWRRLCAHRRLKRDFIVSTGATPLTIEHHAMLNVWQADCVSILRRTAVETKCGYRSSPTENDVTEVLELCEAMKAKLKPMLSSQDAGMLR